MKLKYATDTAHSKNKPYILIHDTLNFTILVIMSAKS